MSLSGNLKEFNLEEILALISESKKNGRLVLSEKGMEGSISFYEGKITSIDPPFSRPPLTARLKEAKLVSKEVSENLARPLSDNLQQDILLSEEAIKGEALEQFLQEEACRDLAELLSWKEAEFVFETKESPEEPRFDLSLKELLDEARVRLEHLEELRHKLASETSGLRLAAPSFTQKEIILDLNQWRMVRSLSRQETLDDVRHRFGQDSFTFFDTLVALLENHLIEELSVPNATDETSDIPAPSAEKEVKETEENMVPVRGKYISFNK